METIKARPLTLADFEDGTIAVGTQVYWRREHAGDITWDPATVERFNKPEIVTEPNRNRLQVETGDGRWFSSVGSLSIASVYGTTTTFAPRRSGEEVYIADEEGEEIPLTPTYGSLVTLTVSMPGVSPEEAEEALRYFMKNFSDRARVKTLTARPLADRRVNVYNNDGGQKGRALALNVLEGEAHTVPGYMTSIVDQASREEYERNMALLRESIHGEFFRG